MMGIRAHLCCLLAACFTGAASQETPAKAAVSSDAILKDLLAKSAAYCEKVKSIALKYVCRQQIEAVRYVYKERVSSNVTSGIFAKRPRIKFEPRGMKTNLYLYDYQIIKKDGALSEKWMLVEKNSRKRNQEVAGPVDIRFRSPNLVFAPVGFLSASWQDHFRYEIAGREMLDGIETVVLRCEPKIRGGENDNLGRIWLAPRDASILRIEWDPSSIQGFDDEAPEGYRHEFICSVDFGIEKNGVRFPSRQVFRASLTDSLDLHLPWEEITYHFLDYKFFTVDVDVVY